MKIGRLTWTGHNEGFIRNFDGDASWRCFHLATREDGDKSQGKDIREMSYQGAREMPLAQDLNSVVGVGINGAVPSDSVTTMLSVNKYVSK